MIVYFHKNFEKNYQKFGKAEKEKIKDRLGIFIDDPFDRRLNNHPLKGKYEDYRSINISGGLRAIYKYINDSECVFVEIGTHSELYS
ncbi:MAG: type II toxin-antitoxin system mRNA interferase toxin, RelE/StbE family [Candidatus Paceibacterota bacterium]|jgi:addiction module RelE/StbE family toxin